MKRWSQFLLCLLLSASIWLIHNLSQEYAGVVSVSVLPAPGSVKLDKTALTLNVEETCKLNPSIPEGTMAEYTYSTSDSGVATVSRDGAVVAVGRGTATLTVTGRLVIVTDV